MTTNLSEQSLTKTWTFRGVWVANFFMWSWLCVSVGDLRATCQLDTQLRAALGKPPLQQCTRWWMKP